ncbi:MAG: IgGFc-binding protein [Sandaracinaceae bacterium]|nr:IgGFc-binding protein [Sandaracinaceae bacterium]
MHRSSLFWGTLLLLAIVTVGCGTRNVPRRDGGASDGMVVANICSPGGPAQICRGVESISCNPDGSEGSRTNCSLTGQVCTLGVGCTTCNPGRYSCDGDRILQCDPTGNTLTPTGVTCDAAAGQSCNALTGTCVSLCDQAVATNSYIGCEYWAAPTVNGVNPEFEFAVVISNPQATSANVTITGPGGFTAPRTVAAGAVETVRLPWVEGLKNPNEEEPVDGLILPRSALVRGGAYRIRSSIPVTVYQFNPLEYRIDRDCAQECDPANPEFRACADPRDTQCCGDNRCFSFTNDASLLLPVHVLTGNYIVMSRPTLQQRISSQNTLTGQPIDTSAAPGTQQFLFTSTPGYVAIVGAEDRQLSVQITARAHISASRDGAVSRLAPGASASFTLGAGDVLQLASGEPPQTCAAGSMSDDQDTACGLTPCTITRTYCDQPPEYDLTGTEIRADGRVMVMGGHECAFVPHYRWACDHLEETIYPLEAWGREFVVAATQPLRSEPNLVRILSGRDNNNITFDPASVHGPVTLNRGQYLEFEASQDFRVTGSDAILVGQFLVGQDYGGIGTSGDMGNGDPSMSLAIPTEQFRTEYAFLAPTTYAQSWVNVIGPVGAEVTIASNGGAPAAVTGWRPVGGTGMQTARMMVPGGSHTMRSTSPFGGVVYGFGSYTSYMYPGGLDLNQINIPF